MKQFLEHFPAATAVILFIVGLGGVVVLTGNLTFEEYLRLIDIPVAGLAVGRGIAARA